MGWGTVVVVFCHNCGHRNPEGVNFCSSCGHALLADGDDATITLHPTDDSETAEENPDVTLVEVPHGAGVLVVTRGPNIGARYLLGEDVVRAGRHPESDIFLDDITVSRRHVEITPTRRRDLRPAGRRLVERDLRQPRADRRGAARPGRRSADRQVQARLPGGWERVSGRTYLSIGDVLTLLREEFPDVTISKIRFLESQGLVNPERSPSGYRKFFEHDVERLRWVLRQQREHFLPLKVIRDRLADGDLDEPPSVGRRCAPRTARPPPASTARTARASGGSARTRVRPTARHGAAPSTDEQPTKADEEAMARILADASRRTARLPEATGSGRAARLQVVGRRRAPRRSTHASAARRGQPVPRRAAPTPRRPSTGARRTPGAHADGGPRRSVAVRPADGRPAAVTERSRPRHGANGEPSASRAAARGAGAARQPPRRRAIRRPRRGARTARPRGPRRRAADAGTRRWSPGPA